MITSKTKTVVCVFALSLLVLPFLVLAQTETNQTADSADATENLLPTMPIRILPGNPLYGLKNFWRNTKLFFTFDPVKKLEKRLEISNQQLLETKKLVENKDTKIDLKTVQKALAIYEKTLSMIKAPQELELAAGTEGLGKKIMQNQLLQQQILSFIEQRLPKTILQSEVIIKQIREKIYPLISPTATPAVSATPDNQAGGFSSSIFGKLLNRTDEQKFLACVDECVKAGGTAKLCEPDCKKVSSVSDAVLKKMEEIESKRPGGFNWPATPPPPTDEEQKRMDAAADRAIQQWQEQQNQKQK